MDEEQYQEYLLATEQSEDGSNEEDEESIL